jgi:hypothetical protein
MVIPFISSVMREVFLTVPTRLKESAYALGSTQVGSGWDIVLPYTRSAVIGGVFLGLGRALGETMAVDLRDRQQRINFDRRCWNRAPFDRRHHRQRIRRSRPRYRSSLLRSASCCSSSPSWCWRSPSLMLRQLSKSARRATGERDVHDPSRPPRPGCIAVAAWSTSRAIGLACRRCSACSSSAGSCGRAEQGHGRVNACAVHPDDAAARRSGRPAQRLVGSVMMCGWAC